MLKKPWLKPTALRKRVATSSARSLHAIGEPARTLEAQERAGAGVHHRIANAERTHLTVEGIAIEVVLRRIDRLLEQHAVRTRHVAQAGTCDRIERLDQAMDDPLFERAETRQRGELRRFATRRASTENAAFTGLANDG